MEQKSRRANTKKKKLLIDKVAENYLFIEFNKNKNFI